MAVSTSSWVVGSARLAAIFGGVVVAVGAVRGGVGCRLSSWGTISENYLIGAGWWIDMGWRRKIF